MSVSDYHRWRIGLSEAGLLYMVQVGIRAPTEWLYRGYSTRRGQSQGGEATQGYAILSASWTRMSNHELHLLTDYVTQAKAQVSRALYMTIWANDGLASGPRWLDVYGRPALPDYQPLPSGAGASGVTFVLNNVIEVNDPASF